jgi:hypothetical protein
LGLAATLASFGPAHATGALTVTPASPLRTDVWDAEPGQSVPAGTGGYVGGTLNATAADFYTFTYGPLILPGATGHGNATYLNEFWVGANKAAAEAAGTVFCNFACGFNPGNAPFTLSLGAGAIPFGFTFDQSGANSTLLNGQVNDPAGATLVTTATNFFGLPQPEHAGPNSLAYIGLADHDYPEGDHDFQDLTVQVSVPEPESVALLGAGLAGIGLLRRRRRG